MVDIYIKNTKVDQFGDEVVGIVSSVLDVSDITKNTGDYSKTFTVPASRINNKLFRHWYDANIDNSFDSRTKVSGRIEIDGNPFKKGKFRLYKVSVEKGIPTSYTINFFGNTIDVKETVGKDELSVLGLSAFDHDFNSSNVFSGLTNGLFSKDIVYTLQAKKRYFYDSNPTTTDFDENNINIASTGGGSGVLWSDLRPSIKLINIIEAVEAYYTDANGFENPIVFSRDFFGTTEFNELYLWLSPSELQKPTTKENVDWDGGDFTFIDQATGIGTYPVDYDTQFRIVTTITPAIGFETIPYTLTMFSDGEEFIKKEGIIGPGGIGVTLYAENDDEFTYKITYSVSVFDNFKFEAASLQERFLNNTFSSFETLASEVTLTPFLRISNQMPNLEIMDFLKGLFNMFKLVVIPQDDGTLYVNTLNSYYNQGKRIDVTKHVDNKKIEVKRGELLNEIDIKFVEGETALANEFRLRNNRGFGDSLVRIKDDNGKLLDGDSLSMEIPFEQFVYERLTDADDDDETNLQIATVADSSGEAVETAANIHYVSLVPSGGKTFKLTNDVGNPLPFLFPVNTPTHTFGITNPLYSNLFEAEFSTWDSVKISNTLYKNHYQSYVSSIFNVKRRSFSYKAVLPIHIITTLELNDVLTIHGNDYRINSYSYNLLDGVTTLDLINGFDDVLGVGFLIPSNINSNTDATVLRYNVPKSSDYTIGLVDNGFGTNWFTVTAAGDFFTFNINESLQTTRNANIIFTLGFTAHTIRLSQTGNFNISFDNDIVTFDNDLITWDNN